MKPLSLQLLQPSDLDAIVELDRLCFGGLWSPEGYLRELDSPNSELLGLVDAAHPETPLLGFGCLWAILDEAHITLLAVRPQCQRQGLGRLLVCGLLAAARRRELARATLEVNANNTAARSLYAQFGFREAGRRRDYYPNGDDALILWLSGIQKPQFLDNLENWDRQIQGRLEAQGWKILKTC